MIYFDLAKASWRPIPWYGKNSIAIGVLLAVWSEWIRYLSLDEFTTLLTTITILMAFVGVVLKHTLWAELKERSDERLRAEHRARLEAHEPIDLSALTVRVEDAHAKTNREKLAEDYRKKERFYRSLYESGALTENQYRSFMRAVHDDRKRLERGWG